MSIQTGLAQILATRIALTKVTSTQTQGIGRNLTWPPVHVFLWHLRSPWSYTWILSCMAFWGGTHFARPSLPRNAGADIPHATSSKCSCVRTWDWQKCTGRDGAGFGTNYWQTYHHAACRYLKKTIKHFKKHKHIREPRRIFKILPYWNYSVSLGPQSQSVVSFSCCNRAWQISVGTTLWGWLSLFWAVKTTRHDLPVAGGPWWLLMIAQKRLASVWQE